MKDRDSILANRFLRPFAHMFAHPSHWHINRRSLARGLAIGAFVAFILPVGQFVLAALLAIPFRANVPISAAATLISNPITFPAIYFAAYKTGDALLGSSRVPHAKVGEAVGFLSRLMEVSAPTALGLLIFGCCSALAAYSAGVIWWRLRLARRTRARRAARS